MKIHVRLVVIGLVLIVLLGVLSACGKNGNVQTDLLAATPSIEPPVWVEPLRWQYVIMQIGNVTDETMERGSPTDMIFRGVTCKILYCNAYEERNVDKTIFFPEEFLSIASHDDLLFVMLDASIYDYGDKKPLIADVFDGKLQAAPFVDGRLVYDESFRKIETLNDFLEGTQTLVGAAAQMVDLLPSKPLENGASIEDVIQFFEKYKNYEAAYQAHLKEIG